MLRSFPATFLSPNNEIDVPRVAEKAIGAIATLAFSVAIGVGASIAVSDPTPAIYWFSAAASSAVIAVFFFDDLKEMPRWKRIVIVLVTGLIAILAVRPVDSWVADKAVASSLASQRQSAFEGFLEVTRLRDDELAKKVPRQHDVEKELSPAVAISPKVDVKVGKMGALNHENPPTLLDLFKKDFATIAGVSDQGFDLRSSDGETIHVDRRILLDFAGKNEFIAFYLPSTKYGAESCLALVDLIRPMVSELPKRIEVTGGDSSGITRLGDLTFSGRVFIYHERPLSNKQKADVIEAYSAKGLDVQFRGLDYLGDKLIAWHQEHDGKAAH